MCVHTIIKLVLLEEAAQLLGSHLPLAVITPPTAALIVHNLMKELRLVALDAV